MSYNARFPDGLVHMSEWRKTEYGQLNSHWFDTACDQALDWPNFKLVRDQATCMVCVLKGSNES